MNVLDIGCGWGGFAEFVNLKSNWLIKKPKGLSRRATMSIGTAGYTAMLCVMELLKYDLNPSKDEVLVSGATGGVGCISIIVLSRMGYNVIALTGKKDKANFLKDLGNPYDILLKDENGKKSINFGIYGIPESILLNKELVIIEKFVGPLVEEDYEKILEEIGEK